MFNSYWTIIPLQESCGGRLIGEICTLLAQSLAAKNLSRGQLRRRIGIRGPQGRTYRYLESRIIWLWVTGVWPINEIDHRSGDATDNRWNNLREADRAPQMWNTKRSVANTTGYKGAYPFTRRWRTRKGELRTKQVYRSHISANGKSFDLGVFATAKEAAAAYIEAAKLHHGDFARFDAPTNTIKRDVKSLVVPTKNNFLGIRGVSRDHGAYRSGIYINGKRVTLGTFRTPIEAWLPYIAVAREKHGANGVFQDAAEVQRLSDLEMSRRASEQQQQLPLVDAPATVPAESVDHETV